MDYGDTVNLPHTTFPMRADLLQRQEKMLRQWQAQDIYRSILEDRRDARPFIIHDGPPYASGQVHVGIGMNKVLKDIIVKYYTMNDRRVPFVPGWDCHGLPIELEVLKESRPSAESLSVTEIRSLCERYALRYVREQKRQFQLLGTFADWDRPYLTMNPSYEAGVLTIFFDLVEKGYIYRDLRPISWCCSCRTALAEAEVEYHTMKGRSLWIHFDGGAALAKLCGAAEDISCSLLVWTTTAWSIPGNVAVAAHPEFAYGAFAYTDSGGVNRVAVILDSLASTAFEAIGVPQFSKIATIEAKALESLTVAHPLFARRVPVVLADYIMDDSGSGLVHIAPGHGLDDFNVGREYGLDVSSPLDAEGRFNSQAGELNRMSLADGEQAIIELMKSRGSLASLGEIEHEYPHCWRCSSPLITRATEQWFVNIDHSEKPDGMTLRQKALLEIQVVSWLPTNSQDRIRGMIENRPDWCISRQRFWGVPIPAFICRGCGKAILDSEAIKKVRDIVATEGSVAWFEKTVVELLPAGFKCPSCEGHDFDKDTNILDVWFESGTSWQPMLIADHRLSFPADLYVEGSDQHRGWFQLSLLPALVSRGKAPYRTVLTHGFVLNEKRERMSRSGGDFVSLEDALKKIPADIIRLYFSSLDTTTDIPLSLDTFHAVEPMYRTLRNTFRFLLGNLYDFAPREDAVHLDDLQPLDLWALCRFHKLISEVSEDYSAYRFYAATRRIHDFCNEDLSKLYFDALKDRLYCEAPATETRRSAQTALHSILMGLVKLLAPVLPYTCDEVWSLTPGHADCPSVHLSRWPKADEQLLHSKRSQNTEDTYSSWLHLRHAFGVALENLRENKTIGGNAEALVRLHVKDGIKSLLGVATRADLRDFLIVSDVIVEQSSDGLEPVNGLEGVFMNVSVSPHPACARCRRHDVTCGRNPKQPDLCSRCIEALRLREKVILTSPPGAASVSPEVRPAALAKLLRARDVRKVALLNEDGRCIAYALHSPSQDVRPFEELQPLADYINDSPDFRDHAALLLGLGEHTDVLFGIGIHHLNYGTPLGGTREWAYPRVRDMLDNLLRLSWGMSVKNAVAELPHGGGKSIIDTCGWDLKVHREFRREIYRDFGQFNATLFGRYICAEDVNNTNADTREMLSACRHVMCLSQGVSGSGNPSRFTALAGWAAAKAGWKFLTGTSSFEGLTIALQGAGNVGRNIAAILIEADPGISKILIADRDPEQIRVIRNLLLKQGKEELLEIVSSKDPTDKGIATASYEEREDEEGKEYILYAPCDILIPVAVGNVINPANVPMLKCRLILPIANNIYSDNDAVAQALFDREIVDVVENNVNWGGAMAAASELLGYDEENVTRACIEAFDRTLRLLEQSREENCPPWQIIKDRASERIFNRVHPAIEAARGYRFIGDVSKDFATWIKEKWLRNIVDVDPDKFAEYSVELAASLGLQD
ncbi:MAG TPA: isoleucine--tRNA ligase [Blastocatellia bacterium]|nr:isoleucine--tRNA ligase [Blastocatellia bacterium]